MWMPVHEIRSMYASHKMWVDAVARDMAQVLTNHLRVKWCLLCCCPSTCECCRSSAQQSLVRLRDICKGFVAFIFCYYHR